MSDQSRDNAGQPTSTDSGFERPFHNETDLEDLDLSERSYSVYECVECENIARTVRDCEQMECHGHPMEPVHAWKMDIERPDLREVLLEVFGLPKKGLDICLCVIGEGPIPPGEVADKLGYDASTIRRYLNELVDMGLLTRSELNREGGGIITVYHSIDITEMRHETLVGFYIWAGEAASLIEQANLTKEDYHSDEYDDGLEEVFWEKMESGES